MINGFSNLLFKCVLKNKNSKHNLIKPLTTQILVLCVSPRFCGFLGRFNRLMLTIFSVHILILYVLVTLNSRNGSAYRIERTTEIQQNTVHSMWRHSRCSTRCIRITVNWLKIIISIFCFIIIVERQNDNYEPSMRRSCEIIHYCHSHACHPYILNFYQSVEG